RPMPGMRRRSASSSPDWPSGERWFTSRARLRARLFGKFSKAVREGSCQRKVFDHRFGEFPRADLPELQLAQIQQGLRPDALQFLARVNDSVVEDIELDQAKLCLRRQMPAQPRISVLPSLDAVA